MSAVIYNKQVLHTLNALYLQKLKVNPNYKLEDLYDENSINDEDILEYKDIDGYDDLGIVVKNKQLQVSREQKSLIEELNEVSEEELLEDLKDILPNSETTLRTVKEEKVVELKSDIEVINVDKSLTTEQQINSIQSQLSERKTEDKVEVESKENIFTPKTDEHKEVKLKKVEEANKDILDMFDNLDNMYINNTDSGIINKTLRLGEDNIGNKVTEKIVLPISGYIAYISGLTLLDKTVIRNTGKNEYEVNSKLYRMVYNHIVEIEPKKPTYEAWLKMTAFNDAKILVYGLYAATYRNGNEFTIKCDEPDCGTEIKVSTDPDSIIQVEDENIHSKIYDITTKVKNFEDVAKVSELGVVKKIKLPKSNLIIEVKNPSLQDHLNMIKQFPRENNRYKALGEIYDLVMFTSKIYMVNVEETKATSKLCVYEPYTTAEEFIKIYSDKIDISEDELLAKGLNELLMKYMIQYEIPKFNCNSCGHEMGPYAAEPTSLLFPRLSR